MRTKYNQIINTEQIASFDSKQNMPELIALAEKEELSPASDDKVKRLLLAIDIQNDFMEGVGSLPVEGSKGDVERLTRWIYKNASKLTQIMCSLDSHSVAQVFHPSWWEDQEGEQPLPFTLISSDDMLSGKWKTTNDKDYERTLSYLKNLETSGKLQLCIWPYHCLSGTKGAELESEFAKMIYFQSAARKTKPILIAKGQDPYSEMYGIIKAEYDPTGYVNKAVLEMIEQYDEIFLAGEASSHCVLESVRQILDYFKENDEIRRRITILEDCMSPISGFEEKTLADFSRLTVEYGIKIKYSSDIIL